MYGPAAGAAAGNQAGRVRHKLDDFQKPWTKISKGSYGTVYRVVRVADSREFALKEVNLADANKADREMAIDEARVLASLDSRWCTKYYDCFLENQCLYIVMQYAPGGDVHHRLKEQQGKPWPEDVYMRYWIQALLGLAHMHARKVIHRDIKSLNLFLDGDGNVLLGDMGIARAMSPSTIFAKTQLGTPYYMSPELCMDKPYNERSDVWALGVVLYEMATGGRFPFDAQNEGALYAKILKGQFSPPQGVSAGVAELVKLCLTLDFRSRPDTRALLEHPFVKARARALGVELNPHAKHAATRLPEGRQPALGAAAGRAGAPPQPQQQPPLSPLAHALPSPAAPPSPARGGAAAAGPPAAGAAGGAPQGAAPAGPPAAAANGAYGVRAQRDAAAGWGAPPAVSLQGKAPQAAPPPAGVQPWQPRGQPAVELYPPQPAPQPQQPPAVTAPQRQAPQQQQQQPQAPPPLQQQRMSQGSAGVRPAGGGPAVPPFAYDQQRAPQQQPQQPPAREPPPWQPRAPPGPASPAPRGGAGPQHQPPPPAEFYRQQAAAAAAAAAAGRGPPPGAAPFAYDADGDAWDPYGERAMAQMALHDDHALLRDGEERAEMRRAIAAAARAPHMRDVLAADQGLEDDSYAPPWQPYRPDPANLPAAGRAMPRGGEVHDLLAADAAPQLRGAPPAGPMAHQYRMPAPTGHYRTAAQEAQVAATQTRYEAPQYGRRRAPDIMYTGPSMREGRPGSARPGGGGGYRGGGGGGRPGSPGGSSTTITNIWGGNYAAPQSYASGYR